jgi:hypothetical protein
MSEIVETALRRLLQTRDIADRDALYRAMEGR